MSTENEMETPSLTKEEFEKLRGRLWEIFNHYTINYSVGASREYDRMVLETSNTLIKLHTLKPN